VVSLPELGVTAGREVVVTEEKAHGRRIRSFVRRAGRLTPAQQRALDELWPKFGIDYSAEPLDFDVAFGRSAPRILEIGFGNGELLATVAAAQPDTDFVGIEVHQPGVGHCLLQLEKHDLSNVRLICHDAIEVLRNQVPDAALNQVNLFFPDPWPKKRHHKRRIVQPTFLALIHRKLVDGGRFHVATDWMNYAEHIEDSINSVDLFETMDIDAASRPETKFELRGKRLGHDIWERVYRRV